MPLPARPQVTAFAELGDGTKVPFHSLSRLQAISLRAYVGREDEAEVMMIAWATDTDEAEARAWYAVTPTQDVGVLVTEIAVFSGLATRDSIAKANGVVLGDGPDPKQP